MTRRVAARLVIVPDSSWIEPALAATDIPIVFEPGEVEHVVALAVRDNLLYDGHRDATIGLGYGAGGVIGEGDTVTILDNERQPSLVCDDLSIAEGDRGRTRVLDPCRLSGPLSFGVSLNAQILAGSATKTAFYEFIDYGSKTLDIQPGKLTGAIALDIYGDTEVEPNEQFKVLLHQLSYNWSSYNDHSPTITILNDDAALTPARSLSS
ncbi:MAG TPA: hypothetical protein VND45_08250 [Thermoanaerobaculia bacterium]|nr:hypothetical protein [Thermoanaerobaculia bacterium]